MSGRADPPQLLVSVRSVEEARTARAGGADILDVKEPALGSLGRANPEVIESIATLRGVGTPTMPLSVALGEVRETLTDARLGLPHNVTFAKLGLARLRDDSDWVARWVQARQRFGSNSRAQPRWIGVIYADADAAHSPPADEVIDAAAATGCAGVLVDTFCKGNGRLLDHATPADLAHWARHAHAVGLTFAVAGRLSSEDLPHLTSVGVDIIAVRTAACREGDRQGMLCTNAIATFKRAVRAITADARGGANIGGFAVLPSGG